MDCAPVIHSYMYFMEKLHIAYPLSYFKTHHLHYHLKRNTYILEKKHSYKITSLLACRNK